MSDGNGGMLTWLRYATLCITAARDRIDQCVRNGTVTEDGRESALKHVLFGLSLDETKRIFAQTAYSDACALVASPITYMSLRTVISRSNLIKMTDKKYFKPDTTSKFSHKATDITRLHMRVLLRALTTIEAGRGDTVIALDKGASLYTTFCGDSRVIGFHPNAPGGAKWELERDDSVERDMLQPAILRGIYTEFIPVGCKGVNLLDWVIARSESKSAERVMLLSYKETDTDTKLVYASMLYAMLDVITYCGDTHNRVWVLCNEPEFTQLIRDSLQPLIDRHICHESAGHGVWYIHAPTI